MYSQKSAKKRTINLLVKASKIELNNPKQAATWLTEAVEEAQNAGDADLLTKVYVKRGSIIARDGGYMHAFKDLNAAIVLSPYSPGVRHAIADMFMHGRYWPAASEFYQDAVRLGRMESKEELSKCCVILLTFPNEKDAPSVELDYIYRQLTLLREMQDRTPIQKRTLFGKYGDQYSDYPYNIPDLRAYASTSPTARRFLEARQLFETACFLSATGQHDQALRTLQRAHAIESIVISWTPSELKSLHKSVDTVLQQNVRNIAGRVGRTLLTKELTHNQRIHKMTECIELMSDEENHDKQMLGALYEARGDYYCFTQQPRNALKDFDKAIELYPEKHLYLFFRGLTKLMVLEYDSSWDDMLKYVLSAPKCEQKYHDAYYAMGHILIMKNGIIGSTRLGRKLHKRHAAVISKALLFLGRGEQIEAEFPPFLKKTLQNSDCKKTLQTFQGFAGVPDLLRAKDKYERICAKCNAILPLPEQRKKCARCRKVNYCCKRCQRSDWKRHKSDCKTLD
eukprot:535475_1